MGEDVLWMPIPLVAVAVGVAMVAAKTEQGIGRWRRIRRRIQRRRKFFSWRFTAGYERGEMKGELQEEDEEEDEEPWEEEIYR